MSGYLKQVYCRTKTVIYVTERNHVMVAGDCARVFERWRNMFACIKLAVLVHSSRRHDDVEMKKAIIGEGTGH